MIGIAAIQMASNNHVNENMTTAQCLIAQAKEKGASLVVLPENFANLGLTDEQTLKIAEPFNKGPLQQQCAQMAKTNQVWLVAGTLPIKSNGKCYASSLMFNPSGECVARYDKIHLFDVVVEGQETYQESAKTIPGTSIVMVDTPFAKIGMTVCYDIRFPELYRALMLKGADIILVPAAFTIPTGKVHWEVLLKARAIENLCYIVAPGQVGVRANGLGTYGHSMIISPWGECLDHLEEKAGIVFAQIDLNKMKTIRTQFPSIIHYRSFVMEQMVKEVKA
jgi:predicted amidohydrolase